MPSKRSKPRRTRSRDHGDMGNSWTVVWVRQNGQCALCSNPMQEAHHRQTRRFGPDCPGNLVGLCASCHHQEVHGEPKRALANGWIVSRHASDPCDKPIWLDGRWVRLSCNGVVVVLTTDQADFTTD